MEKQGRAEIEEREMGRKEEGSWKGGKRTHIT